MILIGLLLSFSFHLVFYTKSWLDWLKSQYVLCSVKNPYFDWTRCHHLELNGDKEWGIKKDILEHERIWRNRRSEDWRSWESRIVNLHHLTFSSMLSQLWFELYADKKVALVMMPPSFLSWSCHNTICQSSR